MGGSYTLFVVIYVAQKNKTSLKNNNEWFIFMTEVDLCQSEKRFFLGVR